MTYLIKFDLWNLGRPRRLKLFFFFFFNKQEARDSVLVDPMEQNFVVVQLLSHVWLFATPWTAAHQASLSFTISQILLKLMSTDSVMPFNHLIFCHHLLTLGFNLSQHQGLFQWVSSLHQVAKVLEFQLQHQSFERIFRHDSL